MLSNPPFGTPWKAELKAWGDIKKDEITDSRFIIDYDGDPEYSLIPDIGDPQMLFLANNVSKMKQRTALGSRIIEVHNSSSLSTGAAGSGASNLRRYIIENDMLEAVVALPEKMFYNTGIGTYLWIVTNKKTAVRKGKVQLIDATTLKSTLKKNIGEKNCEITPELRKRIVEFYMAFADADPMYSKIYNNKEFGYYAIDVQRPMRLRVKYAMDDISSLKEHSQDDDLVELVEEYSRRVKNLFTDNFDEFMRQIDITAGEKGVKLTAKRKKLLRDCLTVKEKTAEPVHDAKGNIEADKDLKESAQIPMLYVGGIDGYFDAEIKPYIDDAWLDESSLSIGYEIVFTKYFY